jgi:hypothetical protein
MANDTKGQTAGKCSVCKKQFKYVRQHERLVHKIYRNGKRHSTALVKVEPQPKPLTFKMMPFVILQDSEGGRWIAERM